MFTGLVEEVGRITSVQRRAQHAVLTVRGPKVCSDVSIGDSVAVNGVCLTVTTLRGDSFTADVSAETLRRTNLDKVASGHLVNLERALRLSDRLGGHFVQGHVDAVGTVKSVVPEGGSSRLTIVAPPEVMQYVIEKGSVTVDGISLTIAGLDAESFWISIIPQTMKETTLSQARAGTRVNLEVDMLAKYVERILAVREGGRSHD